MTHICAYFLATPRSTMDVYAGNSQGSALVPILWNVFYHGVLDLAWMDGVTALAYVDDLTLLVEADDVRDLA